MWLRIAPHALVLIVFKQNAFSGIANSDPHRALSFDRLHNYPGGLAKSHLLPLVLKRFKKGSKAIVALKSKIEKRCVPRDSLLLPIIDHTFPISADEFPRWPNLNHFNRILTEVKYQDSNQWEDIARVREQIVTEVDTETDGSSFLMFLSP